MSDRRIDITRRKILGAVGAVGAAGAGAGFGTSALFNDTEAFEGNSLVAGELDLKVDWEEHYYNGQAPNPTDEEVSSLRRVEGPDDVGDSEVGLPDPDNPVVAVDETQLGTFMENTTTEWGGPTDNPDPGPIELTDVKPGDFGEVTFSYHLFDNPGYVRMEASVTADDENGQNEPERSSGDGDTGAGNGELGEKVRAVLWADPDCDNVFDGSETLLKRGTLDEVMDFLGASGATPPNLDPTATGGRVADGYTGNCHAPTTGLGGPPFDCTEQLWMTDTKDADGNPTGDPGDEPFNSPSDDTTKLYEVNIVGGNAELTERLNLNTAFTADNNGDGAGDYNHVVSIAASVDGATIYLIDKFSKRLGEYDVANDTFTDRGEITGSGGITVPKNSLQAAVSPTGALYFTVFGEDKLYVINDPTSSTTVDTTISLTDQNGDPIILGGSDMVFLSNGTLYLFDSNTPSGTNPLLYKLTDPSTGNADLVGELPDGVGLPGMSVRAAGDGNLIGSDAEGDQLYEIDPSNPVDGNGILQQVATYEMDEVGGAGTDFDHLFGDMTVGSLCSEYCVGLAWYVPRDVGNEIQSDTYTFDITFRTEQCRHNETPFDSDTPTPTTSAPGTEATVQGFPSDDDDGASIEAVDITFPNGFGSLVGTNWSVGPGVSSNTTINGNTIELRYPTNSSNTYSSDTYLDVTVDGVQSGDPVEFVFEPDDDSSVDDNQSVP